MKTDLLILLVLLVPNAVVAGSMPERFYQAAWCKEHKGQIEVVLSDRTRCDCLTTTHAVEVDFGYKWAEAIGQSLNYSRLTGKRAGILLIIEEEKDGKYWIKLNEIIKAYWLPIDLFWVGGHRHGSN